MRLAATDLELKTVGRGKSAYIMPYYLSEKHYEQIKVLIEFMEANLNKKRKDIKFEDILLIFDSRKIGKGLLTTISRFYKFVTISLKDILKDKVKRETKLPEGKDLESFIKYAEKEQEAILNLKAYELRAKIFDIVNNRYNGYVPSNEREKFVKEIEKEFELPYGAIDFVFFSDLESDKILTKEKNVGVEELIGYYNFDVIETILTMSKSVEISTKSLPGFVLKNIIYLSKVNYIFTDVTKTSESYVIKIEPPIELFQEKSKWGTNISRVMTYFLRKALELKLEFKITAIISYRNRNYLYNLDSTNLPLLPYVNEVEETTSTVEIDSKIEAQFMSSWRNMQGWKALPEKEPIIIDKEVIVPDFVLIRDKTKIYLEIVGYYTHKYIQKKKRKINLLAKKGIPIVYLIDEKLRSHFADMRDIKAVYYSKDTVPSKELLDLLEKEYGDFEERMPKMLEKLAEVLKNMNEDQNPVSLKQVMEKIDAYSEKELKRLLSTAEAKEMINASNAVTISNFGFVSKSAVEKIKNFMENNKKIKYYLLKKEFPEIGEAILPICQMLGCRIKWKTFEEIEILYPTRN